MSRLSRSLDLEGQAVTAVLGPTNTGKTHRAITRMLQHRTGVIGLPLRLLAREVYDRVAEERGAEVVALVTGEQKIIPANPRYFVCTVEAMPLDRPVDFLAIDEVQLAADRTRGHVFTDRILHARGLRETMFLGADTIAKRLEELVPTVEIHRQPRMSELRYAGTAKATSLPRKSALVAFSVERVYALAERLRAKHGGVAVVLGALSPRTRNAQVDLFQSGEVPYMVATDAIGMGLNLDLDHVAFSDVGKFDGISWRPLTPAEVAQIAGRAGRYTRDGTFGAINRLGPLDPDVVRAVESHEFPPLELLYWRNSDLDFASPEALLGSLSRRAPREFLVKMRDAEDHETLEALARRPEVVDRATSPERVQLLWEVCQVPDFRKTLTGSHAELVARLFVQLVDDGVLDDDWVGRRIERLDRVDGDIDALTTRIAYIRTWSYLAFRRDWMRDARGWQERTRAIEDRLSDVLHEELTRRFVDRRAQVLTGPGVDPREGLAIEADGAVRVQGERVGAIRGLHFRPDPSTKADKGLLRALRSVLRAPMAERVASLLDAPDLHLDARGNVRHGEAALARWSRGTDRLTPEVRHIDFELVDPADRDRVRALVGTWSDERLEAIRGPMADDASLSRPARELLAALREGLGSVPRPEVDRAVRRLGGDDRHAIARRSIRLGQRTVYVNDLLKPDRVALRAQLWALWHGRDRPALPSPGATSVDRDQAPDAFWQAIGFLPLGPRAVRLDMAEKAAHRARELAREGPFEPPEALMSWLGVGSADLERVLQALGFERVSGGRFRGGGTVRSARGRGVIPAEWG